MEQTRRVHLFRDAVLHRWRIVASLVLLGALAGALLALQRPVTYSSTAAMIINPLVGNPYTTEGQGDDLINMQSEAQLITSDAVTSEVAESLGLEPSSRLLGSGVRVTSPANTQILELTVSGANAELVRDVAAELSRAFLNSRMELAEDSVDSQSAVLEDKIDETEGRLSTAQELANTGPIDERGLQARLADSYEADLFTLRSELIGIQSTPVAPGRITTPATDPVASSGLVRLLIPAVGLLGGLALGIVAAVARERRSNLIRGVDDVTELDVPILADLSRTRGGAEQVEAAARLRMQVLGRVTPPLTIVVAPCSGEGSHRLPFALARSIADLGTACVLVDADGGALPEPSALSDSAPGLTEVMLDGLHATDLLQRFGSNLLVLPPGRNLADAQTMFVGSKLAPEIDSLQSLAAVTIVQAPNLSEIAGEALTGLADALIVVVTVDQTTLRELQRVVALVRTRGITLLGAVIAHPSTDLAQNQAHRQSSDRFDKGEQAARPALMRE